MATETHQKTLRGKAEKTGRIGDPCTYCGETSEVYDVLLAPCCQQCRAYLSSSADTSISARRSFVRGRLLARYGRVIAMPKWDEDDLAELTPGMADYMRRSADAAAVARRRIHWRGT